MMDTELPEQPLLVGARLPRIQGVEGGGGDRPAGGQPGPEAGPIGLCRRVRPPMNWMAGFRMNCDFGSTAEGPRLTDNTSPIGPCLRNKAQDLFIDNLSIML
jgi:hypothetical protein